MFYNSLRTKVGDGRAAGLLQGLALNRPNSVSFSTFRYYSETLMNSVPIYILLKQHASISKRIVDTPCENYYTLFNHATRAVWGSMQ